jgi:hypothetical protein
LRRRLRSLYLLHGLGRVAAVLGALLTVSFVLDWTLEPPRVVRMVHGALSIIVLGWAIRRFLLVPLGRPLRDEELALAVEARVPELEDRLISALQWDRLLEDPENAESRAFMEASAAEAAVRVRAVRVDTLVRTGPSRKAMGIGAAVVGVCLVGAMALPAETAIWMRRSLLLMNEEWPQRTNLTVIGFDAQNPRIVTLGDDLAVEVRVDGEIPDDGVLLHYRAESGVGGRDERDARPMLQSEEDRTSFRFVFHEIPSSFRFWVTGGDDDDGEPVYAVTALVPPAIESVTASLVFPPQTGMAPEQRNEADLEIPAGTKVDLTIVASVPLQSAEFLHPVGAEGIPLTVGVDGRTMTVSTTVTESADWRVDMLGIDGATSVPSRNTRRFTALPDPRPEVQLLFPVSRIYSVPSGRLPVKVKASDNYALSTLELRLRPGRDADAVPIPLAAFGESSAPGGDAVEPGGRDGAKAKVAHAYRLLDLPSIAGETALKPDMELLIRAAAGDNGGSVSTTEEVAVQIAEPSEILRRLSQRQTRIREDLERIRRHLEGARKGALRAATALEGGGDLTDTDRESLRTPSSLAGRAQRESASLLESFGGVMTTYVWNRLLENKVATERTVAIMDAWMRENEAADTVFPTDLWRRLSQAHASREIDDGSILGALLEALGLTDRLHEGPTPALRDHLVALSSGTVDNGRSAAEDAVKRADEAIALVREIGLRLQQWETLHEILEAVRSLEDLQGTIADDLQGDGEEDGNGEGR